MLSFNRYGVPIAPGGPRDAISMPDASGYRGLRESVRMPRRRSRDGTHERNQTSFLGRESLAGRRLDRAPARRERIAGRLGRMSDGADRVSAHAEHRHARGSGGRGARISHALDGGARGSSCEARGRLGEPDRCAALPCSDSGSRMGARLGALDRASRCRARVLRGASATTRAALEADALAAPSRRGGKPDREVVARSLTPRSRCNAERVFGQPRAGRKVNSSPGTGKAGPHEPNWLSPSREKSSNRAGHARSVKHRRVARCRSKAARTPMPTPLLLRPP